MEAAECGAACLAMVFAAFGRWEPLDRIRDSCGVSRDGTSAADIVTAARARGFDAAAYSREVGELAQLPLPQILFWDFDHFVVLEAITRDGFRINDPAHGRRQVDTAEFGRRFTGITLTFTPGPHFRPTQRPPAIARRLLRMLAGSFDMFVAISLASFAAVLIGVLLPGFTRIFVDDFLVQGHKDWLIPLLGAILAAGSLNAVFTALHLRGLQKLQTKIAGVVSARFVWRLFHLPYDFFVRRSPVEISGRTQLAAQVAGTISGPLAQAGVNSLAMTGYVVVMLCFSLPLTLVVLLFAGLELLVLRLVARPIREKAVHLQMAAGQAHSAAVQGVALLEQARLNGSEAVLFDRMIEAAARLINSEQRNGRAIRLLEALPFAMSRLTTLAVLGGGSLLVIWTEMTLGTLLGFLMLTSLFSAALGALTRVGTAFGQSHAAIERLGDSLDREHSEAAGTASASGPEEPAPAATGAIALNGVSFGYPNSAPILSGLRLDVAAGDCIGIIGGSGCGKSTLARLLAGVLAPTQGEILFETARRDGPPWAGRSTGIGYVDQTPFFPNGSLRAALTLWGEAVDTADIRQALADAQMEEVIAGRPGGIDGPIGEGGGGFSGGERQRLAVARALIGRPRILVLDDATSALDEGTEERLLENLRRRNITILLFTNRASAIRHLDHAFALHQGELVAVPVESAYEAATQGLAAIGAPEVA
ncbi:MAG: cysteine peptidase family C39 domain-containing protein [Bosea sp.]|nr:cysteine peptidase family C39 domain-containing protein [Bosea sp. (in: a-proteobacteria)]